MKQKTLFAIAAGAAVVAALYYWNKSVQEKAAVAQVKDQVGKPPLATPGIVADGNIPRLYPIDKVMDSGTTDSPGLMADNVSALSYVL